MKIIVKLYGYNISRTIRFTKKQVTFLGEILNYLWIRALHTEWIFDLYMYFNCRFLRLEEILFFHHLLRLVRSETLSRIATDYLNALSMQCNKIQCHNTKISSDEKILPNAFNFIETRTALHVFYCCLRFLQYDAAVQCFV